MNIDSMEEAFIKLLGKVVNRTIGDQTIDDNVLVTLMHVLNGHDIFLSKNCIPEDLNLAQPIQLTIGTVCEIMTELDLERRYSIFLAPDWHVLYHEHISEIYYSDKFKKLEEMILKRLAANPCIDKVL